MRDAAGGAVEDEQPCRITRGRGGLGNQLGRQDVVKFARTHGSRIADPVESRRWRRQAFGMPAGSESGDHRLPVLAGCETDERRRGLVSEWNRGYCAGITVILPTIQAWNAQKKV